MLDVPPPATPRAPIVDWTRLRPVKNLALLVEVAGEHGLAAETALVGSEVTPEILADPWSQVTGIQEVQVVRTVQQALPDVTHLGLEIGARHHAFTHGPLGLAFASAPTLGDGMALAERLYRLTWSMAGAFSVTGTDVLTITYSLGTLPFDVANHYVQREIASFVALARECLGDPGFTMQAQFEFPAPQDPQALQHYAEFLGTPPVFDADTTAFSFESRWLRVPLPRAEAHTHEFMVKEALREQEREEARERVAGAVRSHIHAHLSAGASIDSAARDLLVSPRTLRRQLQSEGTNFRDLLDTVRAHEAERMLLSTDLTIAQISARLGYESPPAFTNAFRRWQNTTPSLFRVEQAHSTLR